MKTKYKTCAVFYKDLYEMEKRSLKQFVIVAILFISIMVATFSYVFVLVATAPKFSEPKDLPAFIVRNVGQVGDEETQ